MNQANVWYFGDFAGLNFNSRPVEVLLNNNSINQLEGNACICDSTGEFLLGSGGDFRISLWNPLLQPLANGSLLGGNVSSTQSSIIIPQPGNPDLLHVFLINLPLDLPAYINGLTHCIVDISRNDGLGTVILRDDTLLSRVSEKITAIKHRNGHDVWVVTHLWNSDAFYSYLITDEGLDKQAVISQTGTIHASAGFNVNQAVGQMKINPEGNKLALAIYENNMFELFDFNNETGKLSNPVTSPPSFTWAYGIEFSVNGQYLYTSTTNADWDPDFISKLYQFKIADGQSIFNNGILVAIDSNQSFFAALQLATDGKIYVSRGSQYIGVVHNPNRPGTECNFDRIDNISDNGLYLGGRKSIFGLPNFNQSYFLIPAFLYKPNCFGESTSFEIVNTTNIDSVRWDFGDGSASEALMPAHTYGNSGNYNVKLNEYFNGKAYTDSLLININPLPPVKINGGKDTVLLLTSSSVVLDAGSGYRSYLWNDGSTDQTLEVFEQGYNWVEVSDFNCCYNTDTIFVELFYLVIPNAFLPEGSASDKYFQILDVNDAVQNFSIIIYNRLGQQVYKSNDINFKWDGEGCGTGVYYFTLRAVLTNEYPYEYNGNITLIR